jgi:hypothetical protein
MFAAIPLWKHNYFKYYKWHVTKFFIIIVVIMVITGVIVLVSLPADNRSLWDYFSDFSIIFHFRKHSQISKFLVDQYILTRFNMVKTAVFMYLFDVLKGGPFLRNSTYGLGCSQSDKLCSCRAKY